MLIHGLIAKICFSIKKTESISVNESEKNECKYYTNAYQFSFHQPSNIANHNCLVVGKVRFTCFGLVFEKYFLSVLNK